MITAGLLSHEHTPITSVCAGLQKVNNHPKTTSAATSSVATPTGHAPSLPCPPRSSNKSRSVEEMQLCDDQHHQVVSSFQRHSRSLLILSVLLGIVLLGFFVLLLWKAAVMWSRSRPRKHEKYKSVSRYFPFSYKKDSNVNVALPELGMPKGMGAERQVLLEDSEDDEL